MQKLPPSRIAISVALLQSVLALLAWFVYWSIFLFLGPGIDAHKPGHHVTVAHRFGEATLLLGLPVLWSTAAAVLMWFRTKAAWWLSVLGDGVAICVGVVFLSGDISVMQDLHKYPGLIPDVIYHVMVLLLPAAALCLLLSRPMRLHGLASFTKTDA